MNPYAGILKKYARLTNERRRAARDILRKKRSGTKVSPDDLKKATEVLGITNRTYKAYKASIEKKRASVTALRAKLAAAKVKRVALKKSKSTTPKGTGKGKTQVKKVKAPVKVSVKAPAKVPAKAPAKK